MMRIAKRYRTVTCDGKVVVIPPTDLYGNPIRMDEATKTVVHHIGHSGSKVYSTKEDNNA